LDFETHTNESQNPTDNLIKKVEGVFFQLMVFPNGRKRFLRLSRGAEDLLGYTEANFMEQSDLFYNNIYPECKILYLEKEKEISEQMGIFNFNFRFLLPDGKIMWLNVKSVPQKTDGGDYIWTGLFSDINDLKVQENKLVKVNHELEVLNAVNDIILNCGSIDQLLKMVCQSLVMVGGYKLVWIVDDNQIIKGEPNILPIASFESEQIPQVMDLKFEVPMHIDGPSARAILRRETVVTNNIYESEFFHAWIDKARAYGFHSQVSIPFGIKDKAYALNIYSGYVNTFDHHEIEILERVGNNISLAIAKIEEETKKKNYYYLLQERVKELTVLTELGLILRSEKTIELALSKIASLLPGGMQYPESTCVEIHYGELCFKGGEKGEVISAIEEQSLLSNEVKLSIKVTVCKSEETQCFLDFFDEEKLVLRHALRKIQLFIDNYLTLEQLKHSESNLNSVFGNTDVGYLLLDLDGKIITFNRQVSRELFKLFKVKITEGMNLAEDVLKFRAANFISHFLSAKINLKRSEYESYYEYKGRSKYFVVSIFPVLSDTKVCLSVCLTLKDVTKSKLAEMESKQITSDLIVRNRDLEQFSFMISHNLRAPVVNLSGLTQQLKEQLPEEEKEYVINSILTSTSRIEGVINDINKVLMIKHSSETAKSKVSVVKLLDELQSYFVEVNSERKPEFHIDLKDVESIESNKAYIESVFYNLISNAVKFAKPESPAKIKIWTVRKKDKLVIHFKDDGIGIDLEKHQHNVFKLYNRFHNHIEGKGMGLYMTKTQIRLLGGDIEVHSSPNKGTEFIITLPVD
jgi:PAS domain S-box-containing protein